MIATLPQAGPWCDSGVFRVVFDAVPHPMLVVDGDVAILALNRSAEALFGATAISVLRKRSGDALGCVNHAATPRGCGHAPACSTCVVRGSVTAATQGRNVHRQLAKMEIAGTTGVTPVHLCVTASPLDAADAKLVLLSLEDVSDLIQLEALLPICAWCKKVRTGERYWEAVDRFLMRRVNAEFSHAICDGCLAEHYPDDGEDEHAVAR